MYYIKVIIYFLHIFSLACEKWSELDGKVGSHGRKVDLSVPANGECLIISIRNALRDDYGIHYTIEYIKDQIFEEIIGSSKFYVQFTEGTKKEMLENVQSYLNDRQFTHSVVDIVVLAASAALNVNMYILSCNRETDTICLIKAPVASSVHSFNYFEVQSFGW